MAQCIWHDGAVAVLDPAGNVYCPAVPNKPVAKHYGGMADLAPQYKQAFSGRATFIVPIDAGNSQAGYTIGDSSWGPDFYTFDPGVKKFFR